ncbi:M15 family metallopeptidase [Pseudomonas monteilii]|uniref:M15 family metallopeptidase n=1 Tax=Pseudomonas monteilii TaxID=76759 RepID=UPI001F3E2B7B|nr:M15 family metallopeptidase [Pseudomonas monteilii]
MPAFSKVSQERLATCHPKLQAIMNKVILYVDCMIICGYRNQEDQDRAFREGKSKLMYPHGKHNTMPSNAVDVAPYPLDWNDTHAFARLAGYIQAVADSMGISIRWGGDWNRNGKTNDERFRDFPHFELC